MVPMSYVRNAVRAEARTLSAAELKKILAFTGLRRDAFRDHMLISLALGTALRELEIRGLDVRDVAAGPKDIRPKIQLRTFARKGRPKPATGRAAKASAIAKAALVEAKRQRVFIPKSVRRKLIAYLAWKKRNGEPVGPDAPLFVGRWNAAGEHQRLSVRAIRWIWRTWQQRAELQTIYTFHELRHTSLTNLYRVTGDLVVVMKQARHMSVETTKIYTHPGDDEIAAAVDKLTA